jgi:hypothetical protein
VVIHNKFHHALISLESISSDGVVSLNDNVISTFEVLVFLTKNPSNGVNSLVFGTTEIHCQLSSLEKVIPFHPLENNTSDNNAGVETTFHHGVNVIVIHVVSAKLYVHIVQSRATNASNNFFVFCIFLFLSYKIYNNINIIIYIFLNVSNF